MAAINDGLTERRKGAKTNRPWHDGGKEGNGAQRGGLHERAREVERKEREGKKSGKKGRKMKNYII